MAGMGGMGMGAPMTENLVETIEIPESFVGMVIGRGGEQISSIQQQSGARVQMSSPEGNTTGFRTCTIQGPKPCIDKARQLVEEVLSRNRNTGGGMGGQNGSGGGGGHVTAEIMVPGSKCGLVIGKGGETIKGLQESLNVKMLLVQDSQSVSVAPKPLRITGFPDKVEQAKRVVEQLLNEETGGGGGMGGGMGGMFGGPRPGGFGPRSIGEVVVPRSSVGIIIGKGGETIKRLAAESGAKIQFKPDEDPNAQDRCAVIQGTAEQINRATQMISDLVTRGAHGGVGGGQEIFYMHVPATKVGLVIGKGGDTIKQICAESGAHVELSRDPQPNANEKVFVIKGSPYQIHHVQHIIRIKVGDIAPGTPVPPFAGGMGGGAPMGQLGGGNPYGPSHHAFGGGGDFGVGGGAQWSHGNVGGGGQQQDMSAWPNYYNSLQGGYAAAAGGQPGYGAAGAAPQYQAVAGLQQPQQQPQQPQQNMQGGGQANAAPAINPSTGQPDYSAQWCEYYRSMGMHDQADAIMAQMKQQGGAQHPGVNPAAAAGGGAQVGRPQQPVYYNS